MQKINKKGVANVIATTLLILIAISSVTLIGFGVIKLVNNPQLSPETSCINFQLKTPIKIVQACYNQETQETKIRLQRSGEKIELSSLSFILENENFICDNQCGNCQVLLSETAKTYFLSGEKPGTVTLTANNCLISTEEIKDC